MFRIFSGSSRTKLGEVPLLIDSISSPSDTDEHKVILHETKWVVTGGVPNSEDGNDLFIVAIKILLENHQRSRQNKERFIKFFERPMDLMRLLSVNRQTNELRLINRPLIDYMISTNLLMQFKCNMLNELQKRSRGSLDKVVIASEQLSPRCRESLKYLLGLIYLTAMAILILAIMDYSREYGRDLVALSDYTFYTSSHEYEDSFYTHLQAKTDKDLAGIVGCGVGLGLLVSLFAAAIFVLAGKRDSLHANFNSINNAEIKQLEESIRAKIINTTEEEAGSEDYRKWMKHYVWSEKVNQPVVPFAPDDVEAQPVLGM